MLAAKKIKEKENNRGQKGDKGQTPNYHLEKKKNRKKIGLSQINQTQPRAAERGGNRRKANRHVRRKGGGGADLWICGSSKEKKKGGYRLFSEKKYGIKILCFQRI